MSNIAEIWKRRAIRLQRLREKAAKQLNVIVSHSGEHVWVEKTRNDVTGFDTVFGAQGKPALCSAAIIPKMVIQTQPFDHDAHKICPKCAELMSQTSIPAGTVIGTMTTKVPLL